LCLVALLAVLSAHLTRLLDAPRALSLACLLVLAPRLLELATTGYADVPLAAVCGAAIAYAARSVYTLDPRAENLAALLTASFFRVKKDALSVAVCLVGGACVSLALGGQPRRAARFSTKCAVAAGVVAGPWLLFNLAHAIPVPAYQPVTPQTFAANAWRLVEIAPYFGYYLLAPKVFGLLCPALALLALVRLGRWRLALIRLPL